MKTKIIAVTVALSCYFCAASSGQDTNGRGGTAAPSQPSSPTVTTPVPTATPSIFSNQSLNTVIVQVKNTREYKAFANKVNSKINNSKLVKKTSKWRLFLQNIGLAKKTVVRKTA